MTLIFLSHHLVKSAHMHGIEYSFLYKNLSRWLYIHALLDTHAEPLVLCRVYAANSQSVRLRVVKKSFYSKSTRDSPLFNLSDSLQHLLNFAVACSRYQIANWEQVIHIPNVVRVAVQIHSNGKDFLLVVNDLLYYFHQLKFELLAIGVLGFWGFGVLGLVIRVVRVVRVIRVIVVGC